MANTLSIRKPGKPDLFSWDMATEFHFIEQQMAGKPKEATLLKKVTRDYIDVIEKDQLHPRQLESFEKAILVGSKGVWEAAVNKLHLLAFHYPEAKSLIKKLICSEEIKITDRALNTLSQAFELEEVSDILRFCFEHKSKKVRDKAAVIALDLRNEELLPLLKEYLDKEQEESVVFNIQFAINNMHQPPGELVSKIED